ncbi:hypothetical protein BDR04DRAFT_86134, partial [Suillus decipiens]
MTTVRKLVESTSRAFDVSCPAHMIPLRAQQGGILERRGHAETRIDLLLGMYYVELANVTVRRSSCRVFAHRWGDQCRNVDVVQQERYIIIT